MSPREYVAEYAEYDLVIVSTTLFEYLPSPQYLVYGYLQKESTNKRLVAIFDRDELISDYLPAVKDDLWKREV